MSGATAQMKMSILSDSNVTRCDYLAAVRCINRRLYRHPCGQWFWFQCNIKCLFGHVDPVNIIYDAKIIKKSGWSNRCRCLGYKTLLVVAEAYAKWVRGEFAGSCIFCRVLGTAAAGGCVVVVVGGTLITCQLLWYFHRPTNRKSFPLRRVTTRCQPVWSRHDRL